MWSSRLAAFQAKYGEPSLDSVAHALAEPRGWEGAGHAEWGLFKFAIADREDLSYREKLQEYRKLADAQLEVDKYREFCARHLAHFDEVSVEWVESDDFDRILVDTVRSTFPTHEHEEFIADTTQGWAGIGLLRMP